MPRLIQRVSAVVALVAAVAVALGAAGAWTADTALPEALGEVSAVATGGLVYVAGGNNAAGATNTLRSFDPVTHAWTTLAPYPGAARNHAGLAALNGFVYLVGGLTQAGEPVASLHRYDPGQNVWATLAPMPRARAAAAVGVIGARIYVAGGIVHHPDADALADLTAYDPLQDAWQTLAPLPTARDHVAGAVLNGKFYVIGGRQGGDAVCTPERTVEVFDPTQQAWSAAPSLLTARAGAGTGVAGGRIQVFGGDGYVTNCGPVPPAEEFTEAEVWRATSALLTPRHNLGSATVGNAVFAVGGKPSNDTISTINERLDWVLDPAPLPSPWSHQDIGTTGLAGTASFSNGAFSVKGAGADIWGTADAFHFVFRVLDGDGEIVARVASVQNTNAYAKAGVMIREALSRNAKHVLLDVKPGTGGLELLTRAATSGTTAFVAGATGGAPVWVRLVRAGSTITGMRSPDGVAWTSVGSTTVDLARTVYVGLAVSSHSTSALNTSVFDNVSLGTGGSGGNVPPTVTLTSPSPGAAFTEPAAVNLAATAGDSDGAVASVSFYSGSTLLGTDTTAPYTFSWTGVPSGTYSVTARATDTGGASTTSAAVTVTVASASGLPSPWSDRDVGTVGLAGSASGNGASFVVRGAGSDIYYGADSFHYVYQPLSGDGRLVTRVTALQQTNTYAKAGVMIRQALTAGSAHVLLDIKPAGGVEFMQRASTGANTSVLATVGGVFPYWLQLARSGSTVKALVSNDGVQWLQVGSATVSFSSDVYIGLAVTSHTTSALARADFDNVTVAAGDTSPTNTIGFTRKTLLVSGSSAGTAFGVSGFDPPTSLTTGPDGRLWIATLHGAIFVATMDAAALDAPGQVAVTRVQRFDQIASRRTRTCNINGVLDDCQYLDGAPVGRQVTGIAIGPESTSTHIVLYVSHSDPRAGKHNDTAKLIDTYSGALARLTLDPDPSSPGGYRVVSDQDLLVGLPRSRDVHAVNGVAFGPDGWLYMTIGGNTNRGQPSTFFSFLPEYYLAATVVRLNLSALAGRTLPLDLSGVRGDADMSPYAGLFEVFATGYRNAYDLVWHSNGRLYLNDNNGNLGEGNTPGTTDGCATPSIDPGTFDDRLYLVTPGAHGGHPNPTRAQCVLFDGSMYSPPLSADPGYTPPLLGYTDGASTDGIAEYTSNAFNGAMKGNLISATYAGNSNVRRVILGAAGTTAASQLNLGMFTQPVDVATDKAGHIFVAEIGAAQVTVMTPVQGATCPDATSTDDDGDGYKDTDEATHGTDPCNAASTPPDFDRDFVGDLTDPDDDNDGVPDTQDQLGFDAQNGSATPLPLAFEWNPGDAALGRIANSGFPGTQIPSSGPRVVLSHIRAGDAGGYMSLITDPGTAAGTANSQVNGLQIGFDSSLPFRIWTRVVEPFTSTAPADGHVGAVFFGPDQDNFARLGIVGRPGGGKAVQLAVEQGGAFTEVAAFALGDPLANLDLMLVGDPAARTVTAYYDVNEGGAVQLVASDVPVPGAWFGNNTSAGAARSLAGYMVSHGTATQTSFVFDFFRLDRSVTLSLPAPAGLSATAGDATVALGWSAVAGADGYAVYRSTTTPVVRSSATRLNGGQAVTGTTFTDTAVLNGTKYFYVVSALGGATGESAASNEASATPAAPPSVPTATWSSEAPLVAAIREAGVASLNGLVYVTGGRTAQGVVNTVMRFDPQAHAWTAVAPYPGAAREQMGATALNGYLYVAGGYTGAQKAVDTVQRYDPATNTWSTVAPLPRARYALALVAAGGRLFAIGGLRTGKAAVTEVTTYDPATNQWVAAPSGPVGREHASATVLGTRIYVVGGRPGSNAPCGPLATVDVFDTVSRTWSSGPTLPTARAGNAAGSIGGRLQVAGGVGGGCGPLASAEELDPATGAWRSLPDMPTARSQGGGAVVGTSLFVPGGTTTAGIATSAHDRLLEQ